MHTISKHIFALLLIATTAIGSTPALPSIRTPHAKHVAVGLAATTSSILLGSALQIGIDEYIAAAQAEGSENSTTIQALLKTSLYAMATKKNYAKKWLELKHFFSLQFSKNISPRHRMHELCKLIKNNKTFCTTQAISGSIALGLFIHNKRISQAKAAAAPNNVAPATVPSAPMPQPQKPSYFGLWFATYMNGFLGHLRETSYNFAANHPSLEWINHVRDASESFVTKNFFLNTIAENPWRSAILAYIGTKIAIAKARKKGWIAKEHTPTPLGPEAQEKQAARDQSLAQKLSFFGLGTSLYMNGFLNHALETAESYPGTATAAAALGAAVAWHKGWIGRKKLGTLPEEEHIPRLSPQALGNIGLGTSLYMNGAITNHPYISATVATGIAWQKGWLGKIHSAIQTRLAKHGNRPPRAAPSVAL